jgi:UDP-2,3-diacylglucosamine pyrophosphatase LpxH
MMQNIKNVKTRNVKSAVISDLHLETYACKVLQVLDGLKAIIPEILVLNGNIVDECQVVRSYFPFFHQKEVHQLIKM